MNKRQFYKNGELLTADEICFVHGKREKLTITAKEFAEIEDYIDGLLDTIGRLRSEVDDLEKELNECEDDLAFESERAFFNDDDDY